MRRSKRTLSKGKIYGFNPWADQVHTINQIMEETGEKSESIILRDLIDEALAARRRKSPIPEGAETPQAGGAAETLQMIQTLLLRLVRQGETSLQIQDVSLALLQDTLAEAYAGRRVSWSLVGPGLKEKGLNANEIAKRFDSETTEAKDHAYSVAKQIRKSQRPKA
jgi:hypothetical protein